jgi:hypothetical protein
MPISKPDHVQVHRIEFAKGTNLPRLIDEVERTIQSARYASYAALGVTGLGVVGVTYGLYKLGQAIAGAWEDFKLDPVETGLQSFPVIGPVVTGFYNVWSK